MDPATVVPNLYLPTASPEPTQTIGPVKNNTNAFPEPILTTGPNNTNNTSNISSGTYTDALPAVKYLIQFPPSKIAISHPSITDPQSKTNSKNNSIQTSPNHNSNYNSSLLQLRLKMLSDSPSVIQALKYTLMVPVVESFGPLIEP